MVRQSVRTLLGVCHSRLCVIDWLCKPNRSRSLRVSTIVSIAIGRITRVMVVHGRRRRFSRNVELEARIVELVHLGLSEIGVGLRALGFCSWRVRGVLPTGRGIRSRSGSPNRSCLQAHLIKRSVLLSIWNSIKVGHVRLVTATTRLIIAVQKLLGRV
jgi:hypothetical protein